MKQNDDLIVIPFEKKPLRLVKTDSRKKKARHIPIDAEKLKNALLEFLLKQDGVFQEEYASFFTHGQGLVESEMIAMVAQVYLKGISKQYDKDIAEIIVWYLGIDSPEQEMVFEVCRGFQEKMTTVRLLPQPLRKFFDSLIIPPPPEKGGMQEQYRQYLQKIAVGKILIPSIDKILIKFCLFIFKNRRKALREVSETDVQKALCQLLSTIDVDDCQFITDKFGLFQEGVEVKKTEKEKKKGEKKEKPYSEKESATQKRIFEKLRDTQEYQDLRTLIYNLEKE